MLNSYTSKIGLNETDWCIQEMQYILINCLEYHRYFARIKKTFYTNQAVGKKLFEIADEYNKKPFKYKITITDEVRTHLIEFVKEYPFQCHQI